MKIKVAFGSWEEAEEFSATAIALDGGDTLTDHYHEVCAEHRTEFGEVREAWLHVPDDVIARLFSVPTINPKMEIES
jgi:hypothetical protein